MHTYNKFIIPAVVFLLLFTIAFFSQWEYDEAWSYMGNLHLSIHDIILYTKFRRANNHILNSLWFHALQALQIKPVIVYRLISLACFAGYTIVINKLIDYSAGLSSSWHKLVFFCMPYILYFTLGRGYAMAITSFAAALYFYKLFNDTQTNRHLFLFVIFGCLSSVSLFSFCFPFMAMLLLLGITNFKKIRYSLPAISTMFIVIPVIAYIFYAAGIVNKSDPDIIGSDTFFRNGTISSIITFICQYDYLPLNIFLVAKTIFCLSLVPLIYVLIKRKTFYSEWVIAGISLLLMVVSHYLFHSKYPLYRSISYLIILLYLPVVYTNIRQQNIIISIHLAVISLLSLAGLGIAISNSFKPGLHYALSYVASQPNTPFHTNTILIDNYNPNILVYNKLYFNDTIKIIQLEDIEDDDVFYRKIDSVNYVICSGKKIRNKNKIVDFTEKIRLATDVYPEILFKRK